MLMILLLSGAAALQAQGIDIWNALKNLQTDQRIWVLDKQNNERNGWFRSVSDTALKMKIGSNELTIARGDIRRVAQASNRHRLRNTLIGAGIGVGLALVLEVISGAFTDGAGFTASGHALVWGVFAGGPTAIGAALPGRQVVYRAPRR
jgi:hypothetical protein